MAETDSTHSELASFGEELRREREIRGISLKEIADSTKISKRFLEAIERNDHRTLPAPVFTRGFVREYARYLGLNADEMVTRYNYAAAGDDRIEQSSHLNRLVQPSTPPPVSKGIPPAYARIDRNIYLLFGIIAALSLVALWAIRFKREARAEAIDAVRSSAAPTTAPAIRIPSKPPSRPAAAPAPVDDLLHLTLELNDDSWVTLDGDGKTLVSDELRRGERHTFEAHDSFRFRTIGNAGGVDLTLNNVPIPALGKDGQVLHDRVFDRAWLTAHAAPGGVHTTP
jgi:transcriptional regulator with XRE-family HTH domain